MPDSIKYRETEIRGMLHIVWVADKRIMCTRKPAVDGYAVWDIGAHPGTGVYCRECIKMLLTETEQ